MCGTFPLFSKYFGSATCAYGLFQQTQSKEPAGKGGICLTDEKGRKNRDLTTVERQMGVKQRVLPPCWGLEKGKAGLAQKSLADFLLLPEWGGIPSIPPMCHSTFVFPHSIREFTMCGTIPLFSQILWKRYLGLWTFQQTQSKEPAGRGGIKLTGEKGRKN
jgi:hypothetical protein